jgi:hypothetical protein
MAVTYTADSTDGPGNSTGEAEQQYGSPEGTTHTADSVDGPKVVETKVVSAPAPTKADTSAQAEGK